MGTVAHKVEGVHTRVGIPGGGHAGICVVDDSSGLLATLRMFGRSMGPLVLTGSVVLRCRGGSITSSTMSVIIPKTAICLPLRSLMSFRRRERELGGRRRELGDRVGETRKVLTGREFADGTPTSGIRTRHSGLRGCAGVLRRMGREVSDLEWL